MRPVAENFCSRMPIEYLPGGEPFLAAEFSVVNRTTAMSPRLDNRFPNHS